MSTLEAIYLIDIYGSVLLQIESRGRISSVTSEFIKSEISKSKLRNEEPPFIIYHMNYLVFQQLQDDVRICIPVTCDTEPLYIHDVMRRIIEVVKTYFGSFQSSIIEKHTSLIAQLLIEMIDYGYAMNMEPNALQDVIPTPSLMKKFMEVTGLQPNTPSVHKNTVPWRTSKARYTNNEFFIRIIERVFAVYEGNNQLAFGFMKVDVECKSQLSGIPELLLYLTPGSTMESAKFHNCINLKRWKDHPLQLQFIPPEGKFILASFHADLFKQKSLPLSVEARNMNDGNFEIRIRNTGKKPIENLEIRVPLPVSLSSVSATHGDYLFRPSKGLNDEGTVLEWTIKKIEWTSPAYTLKGALNKKKGLSISDTSSEKEVYPKLEHLTLHYKYPLSILSHFKVESLKVVNRPDMKPFKGVKHSVIAQDVSVRFK
ncbi:AP-3 adaptor complex subunit Apm3 [Schizosaccharomyces cryophilus OY26]|uniref:AP-3 adaptor complex subunit Apm3 n=1 Tax=Schizosaccharomyces cryophilus (strain OY26 / ATCC MYA-4695 / CBS 11777 / NBRC 106824 / NRRL Y48691) TaxID=653667 RepID=S9WXE2_SCHCR|nr:AP-3 adaptor complex subunit Apm3 [Schizosaccharomyces cryophilus OY26]EPY49317.1 AP-3 adaptor complex subunit Apm3 [Schizosaccharomyces cryophilus OY26]